ncbi:hypothetical protein WICANDRAFT_65593 [Wickerhamomyces anomalus NRRL Y-366-8]|uniref:Uncharacterized protein n=1 Tax=Wickerhamomyces anomalus (strain ATCC 58044 / CBS 1984 / NCYC 433 / NRRL Y-366-8) TaxID=683960 RepID=A0A1E3NW24_WICAA|nr:uncharacterized protein WICANDRAFT_65593 [Wickerhamomyces anomalus NRRL Y-366-8]ODQ57338.1 hypothetical protein WICANDRAFT_65593 [Wickerhamomyces anomalus NRRL Y-366-8]
MSARRDTSDAGAADVATTEEAQGREVSGRSSHGSAAIVGEEPAMRPRGEEVTTPENVMKNLNSQVYPEVVKMLKDVGYAMMKIILVSTVQINIRKVIEVDDLIN